MKKKFVAVLCTVALAATSVIPALAEDASDSSTLGHAYIAFGADTVYIQPGALSELSGTVTLCTDDSGDWNSFIDTNTSVDYDALMEINDEGATPTGIYLTGTKAFGFGYNSLDKDDDGNPVWVQVEATEADDDGVYSLTITDMDLTEDFCGDMFYDVNWGWGGSDFKNLEISYNLMYGEEEVLGSWNTYYYDANQVSADVTQTEVDFANGTEFTLEADFATPLSYAWFVAPTLVFDSLPALEDGQTYADLYDVDVKLYVDGDEVTIDETAGDLMWAEATGDNAVDCTARVYGGYNEWGSKYVDESVFEGASSIKYVITISEIAAEDTGAVAPVMLFGLTAVVGMGLLVSKKKRM